MTLFVLYPPTPPVAGLPGSCQYFFLPWVAVHATARINGRMKVQRTSRIRASHARGLGAAGGSRFGFDRQNTCNVTTLPRQR